MDWHDWLNDDEMLHWQGRPARRCFTFRHWQKALFGSVILVVGLWWLYAGVGVMQERQQWWWGVLPLPAVILGVWLSAGQLLTARLEWRQVFYALSDRRLLVQCGLWRPRLITIPCSELSYARLTYCSESLGHVYVEAGPRRLTLCCVEQPHQVIALLETVINANHRDAED
jgi:hypothetical protein